MPGTRPGMTSYPWAYLRAAQAYILISMPTATSTIFGVFQVIASSLGSDQLRSQREDGDRPKLRCHCSGMRARFPKLVIAILVVEAGRTNGLIFGTPPRLWRCSLTFHSTATKHRAIIARQFDVLSP
jgi:hypothetical protein